MSIHRADRFIERRHMRDFPAQSAPPATHPPRQRADRGRPPASSWRHRSETRSRRNNTPRCVPAAASPSAREITRRPYGVFTFSEVRWCVSTCSSVSNFRPKTRVGQRRAVERVLGPACHASLRLVGMKPRSDVEQRNHRPQSPARCLYR